MKNKKVCNKTRSPPTSLLSKGQGTEHTTVKLSIGARERVLEYFEPFAVIAQLETDKPKNLTSLLNLNAFNRRIPLNSLSRQLH